METEEAASTSIDIHPKKNSDTKSVISPEQNAIISFVTAAKCLNESSSTDANGVMEPKVNANNESGGASPKLLNENKNITTNSQSISSSPDNDNENDSLSSENNQFFYEDEVFRIDKNGQVKFGLIMQSAGDDQFNRIVPKGKTSVLWYPKGNETLISEKSIGLADRTLMPGDVVRRLVPGKETQRGYCRDINTRADVKILGTNYVIKNVNAERLTCVSEWQTESAVCLDSWVGSIQCVEKKAVLRATNGCLIELSSDYFHYFDDHYNEFSPKKFFVGNTIVGKLPSHAEFKVLTPELSFRTKKERKIHNKKVEKVYTDSVKVYWQCKALSNEANLQSISLQPNPCVRGDDLKRLKRLNLFESCMLQLNDRNYLTFSSCDSLMTLSAWELEQYLKYKPLLKYPKEENKKTTSTTTPGRGINDETMHQVQEKVKKKPTLVLEDKSTSKMKRNFHKSDRTVSGNKKESTAKEFSNKKANIDNDNEDEDADEWISTDEESDRVEDDIVNCDVGDNSQVDIDAANSPATMSPCTSPSPQKSPKCSAQRHRNKISPKVGDELVTEAMFVYSTATVVWQDGSIEYNIPSTELYPIHHLDNHEFFPGDFVVNSKKQSGLGHRDYGVIQTADHEGRLCHVKWYTTYTSADEGKPTYNDSSVVSVYDLKDHPDFQYRPGTMVIRVANFVGEDANCTAGQIIDNYVDGRIKVWWVDGHISLCWPQDLFEVGHYDHHTDWEQDDSDDSWETESESSEFGSLKSRLSYSGSQILSNIEKARAAIARLEEIFNLSPNFQNNDVMKKLLGVYKACRYIDRLLNTNFFHEDNFMGLIERVCRVGNLTDPNCLSLNDDAQSVTSPSSPMHEPQQHYQYSAIVAVNSCGQKAPQQSSQQCTQISGHSSKEYAPKVLFNISSTPFKCTGISHITNANTLLTSPSSNIKRRCSPAAAARQSPAKKTEDVPSEENFKVSFCDKISASNPEGAINNVAVSQIDISPNKCKQYNAEKQQLLKSAKLSLEKAFEKTSQLKTFMDTAGAGNTGINNSSTSEDDSGNFSRNVQCDCSSPSCTSSSDLTNIETNNSIPKTNDNQKSISCSSIELPEDVAPEFVCGRLCALLKDQLNECLDAIRDKFYKSDEQYLSNNGDKDSKESIENIMDIASLNGIDALLPMPGMEVSCNTLTTADNGGDDDRDKEAAVAGPINGAICSEEIAEKQENEYFKIVSSAPRTHKFYSTVFTPNNSQQYFRAVQKEHRMLRNSLPPGVWVRSFEDRMDLLSVMIEGPKNTPYEDGMFFFDIQLGRQYPKGPPLCHYISFCSDRLNPNLYEDGKVCVSLLGTWTGSGTEVWGPKSTLLQVIVSIQGLILVAEPYFNEAGYESQKGTQQGRENSRMYNEMVMIKMVQATTKLIGSPVELFRKEIEYHFRQNGWKMYDRINRWLELSKESHKNPNEGSKREDREDETSKYCPEFPLVPASRGFCLSLEDLLDKFRQKLSTIETESTSAKTKMSA